MPIVVPFVKAEARSPLRHVFMVGAGFSKAIHDAMPTLDQVGQVIARRIVNRPALGELPDAVQATLRNGFIPGGDLEAWLSTLATPPPFVSEIEAHFYAGVFAQVAFDIGEEIEASESKVLAQDPPPWLGRLVRIWNVTGATVITFNYDTLVEHAGYGQRQDPAGTQTYDESRPAVVIQSRIEVSRSVASTIYVSDIHAVDIGGRARLDYSKDGSSFRQMKRLDRGSYPVRRRDGSSRAKLRRTRLQPG